MKRNQCLTTCQSILYYGIHVHGDGRASVVDRDLLVVCWCGRVFLTALLGRPVGAVGKFPVFILLKVFFCSNKNVINDRKTKTRRLKRVGGAMYSLSTVVV